MNYTAESQIKTMKDVSALFKHMVRERNLVFQPDELLRADSEEYTLTQEECDLYNQLMDQAFDVCEKYNSDIYEIAFNIMYPEAVEKPKARRR